MASFKIFRKGGSAMSGILNVLGMAVAFAAFYIILVQVDYDLNFNKGIKDSEKIFVMSSGDMSGNTGMRQLNFCRPMAEIILEAAPNIECGGAVNFNNRIDSRYWIENDGERQNIDLQVTGFSGMGLATLGFEAVHGSLDDLSDRNSLAVSETIAERFGFEVGMILNYVDNEIRTIKAVYKDMPENSHFRNVHVLWNLLDQDMDSFSQWSYTYFVKLHDPSQVKEMEENLSAITREYLLQEYFADMPSPEEMGMTPEEMDNAVKTYLDMAEVRFIPIDDLYFSDNLSTVIERSSKTSTAILIIVAILIVGIAFINYINFFFAQIPERIRAVNTKKVLGCTRRDLIISTVTESITIIILALIMAFAFVMLFNMSQLTHLITAESTFAANISVAAGTVAIAIVIAIISSLYPAFYITSFEPAMVLKGSFSGTKTGQRLRYVLISLQFVISIVLIICSAFINLQRRYMVNFDMGFDKEQLLYVQASEYIGQNAETVEEQLKADPQIVDVTWAAGSILASQRMGWGRDWNGTVIHFQCYPVAYDFPKFMGIDITEGRSFTKEDETCENGIFIFNESARRHYGFTLNDRVSGHVDMDAEIAGFCEDFSFKTLKEEVTPFALYVFGKNPWWHPSTAFIRVAPEADYKAVMKHIGKVLSGWV